MSLAFLGMDDEPGLCPSCSGSDGLVYVSGSSSPVTCDGCILLRKAKAPDYFDRLKAEEAERERHWRHSLKEVALELGRKRLERMKNG